MTWRFVSASVVGTSHAGTSLPCQDFSLAQQEQAPSGQSVLILLASDGAGSAKYSQIGAETVCNYLATLIAERIRSGFLPERFTQDDGRNWIVALQEYLSHVAQEHDCEMRDLAATCVAAILGDTGAYFLQIGDGGIVFSAGEADSDPGVVKWEYLYWPSKGEFVNTTRFVTDVGIADSEALQCGPLSYPVQEVALFTDGLEHLVLNNAKRRAHAPFFESMFKPLRASTAEGLDAPLQTQLDEYLRSGSVRDRTDDDITLMLACRRETQRRDAQAPANVARTE